MANLTRRAKFRRSLFFELIPRVRCIVFPNGSHMCHLDGGGLRERVLKVVGDFLAKHQAIDKAVA